MKRKLRLFLLVSASTVMGALAQTATAAEYSVDAEGGGSLPTFTGSGATAQLTVSFGNIHCTANSSTGKYTIATTGNIEFTFTGCTQFGNPCTTSGQSSGTITTTELTFHNIMTEATLSPKPYANGTPGILVTMNGGTFASFTCSSGNVTVKGTGLIGDLVTPTCTDTAFTNRAIVSFTSSSTGHQSWTQGGTIGTIFEMSGESGMFKQPLSVDLEETISLQPAVKMTCP